MTGFVKRYPMLFVGGQGSITHMHFDIDLSQTTFITNIFSSHVSFLQRVREAAKYDVIIYLSDGSIPMFITKNLIIT